LWTEEELAVRIEKAVEWLKDKKDETGADGLLCGLSGGVDSAVVAALCHKAVPGNSLGVIMPCHSNPLDREDALLAAQTIGIKVVETDLGEVQSTIYDKVEKVLNDSDQLPDKTRLIAQGNLKARLRMAVLYTVANLYNYLVVGTDNAAESYTGYFTKYGDGGVDLLPISSLTKTEVRSWAKLLGLPEKIVFRTPSAGLWPDQTDEEEMGLTYDLIDKYLLGEKVPDNVREKIEWLHQISEHKRKVPSGLKIPLG